jgi:hypothetical protein
MEPAMTKFISSAALALVLALAGAATASAADPAPTQQTTNIQGDQKAWIDNPNTHAFYALTVAAFANGPAKVDKAKYEADSMRIFGDLGKSMGVPPEAMQDHLKLIPDQMIQIATEDPKVLTSYDKFIAAVMGPQ